MASSVAPSEPTTTFTMPTLSSLHKLENSDAELSTASFSSWFPARASHFLRTAVLLFSALTSATVASCGLAILGYLVLTHSLTPQQLWYSTPMQLDVSGMDLTSYASMIPSLTSAPKPIPGGAPAPIDPGSRFLPPGQHMDVWLDLAVPGPGAGCRLGDEFAHVIAELVSADGRGAARSTQPVVLRVRSASFWSLLAAPLRWTGLWKEHRYIVPVKLFSNYIDRRDIPFTGVKVTIKPRKNDGGPMVLSAEVRVHLRVGIIRKVLYHLRPYTLLAFALGAGAACAAVGGSLAATAFLILLAYVTLWEKRGEGARRAGGSLQGASDSESDLLAGESSAGTTPRDLELSDEEETAAGEGEEGRERGVEGGSGGGAASSPLSSLALSPREEKPWQQLLKQLPVAGRPAPGDDTPYVGSEATRINDRTAGMGSGRTEIGGGGIRLRGNKPAPST